MLVVALAVLFAVSPNSSELAGVTVTVVLTEVTPAFGVTVAPKDCEAPDASSPAVQVAAPDAIVQPDPAAVTEPPVAEIFTFEPAFCVKTPLLVMPPVTATVPLPDAGAETVAATS